MDHNSLLDLNDDVLIIICLHLTITELSVIASLCTRLRTIARKAFSLRYKSSCMDIDMGWPVTNTTCIRRRQEIPPILRNFGDLVTKLKVTFLWNDHQRQHINKAVFNLMVMYCTGPLDSLELKFFTTQEPDDDIVDATALFCNVKELILEGSTAVDAAFLADANQLTTLKLNKFHSSAIVKLLSNDLPKLQSLKLVAIQHAASDSNQIKTALAKHKNLQEIELSRSGFYDLSFVDELPELRMMTISPIQYVDFEPVIQLDKLTAMKLSINSNDKMNFLEGSMSLESLEDLVLDTIPMAGDTSIISGTRFMNALIRFTNLKELSFKFDTDFNDDCLAHLRRLDKLHSLTIRASLSITGNGLVGLVHRLPQLKRLAFHTALSRKRVMLQASTYSRICDIYRGRNQNLVITNFDKSKDFKKQGERQQQQQLFGEGIQQEFVQFISMEPKPVLVTDFIV